MTVVGAMWRPALWSVLLGLQVGWLLLCVRQQAELASTRRELNMCARASDRVLLAADRVITATGQVLEAGGACWNRQKPQTDHLRSLIGHGPKLPTVGPLGLPVGGEE